MAFAAKLIIDGRTDFDVFAKYYTMFPYDKSTSSHFVYKTLPPVRVRNLTFERLLDAMISMLSGRPASDNFIIVTHGAYEHGGDFGKGLLIPLMDGSPMKATYDILGPLLDKANNSRPTTELEDWEKNYYYQNDDIAGGREIQFRQGQAQTLVEKMRQLRLLKPRIVELRACNLGTNESGLAILGQCLGARFIVAPKKKMFAVSVNADFSVMSDKAFDMSLSGQMSNARVFTNPAKPSDRIALRVSKATARTLDVMTTSKDLHWFTDSNIWTGGTYPPSHGRPSLFYMEGMDQTNGSFALPQDQAWCDTLYSSPVLPGNMI